MNLKSVDEIGENKKVILRIDSDLPMDNTRVLDNYRLKKSIPTIKLLIQKKAKILILGHRGRPSGVDLSMSLKPAYLELMSLLIEEDIETESVFVEDIHKAYEVMCDEKYQGVIFLENIRFFEGEESGDTSMFEPLRSVVEAYVNDAFAVAHRRSASVLLFNIFETFYGLSFVDEAKKIETVVNSPSRPVTLILGGAKEDKLKHISLLTDKVDYILIGGKLPKLVEEDISKNDKVVLAKLRDDGLDLSDEDIADFKQIIDKSSTIIWAGAMGFYEDVNCKKGTLEIARAVAQNSGYKIAAGGDTGASLEELGLREKIDYYCSGGGVMLEFLAKGTLPAWKE